MRAHLKVPLRPRSSLGSNLSPSYTSSGIVSAFRTRFNTPKNFVPVPADHLGLVHVREPDFTDATGNRLKATWIGHTSFLIEPTAAEGGQRGKRFLLGPVWSNRVRPFGMIGPIRFTPPPCSIDELPDIDAICISHDHYEHLDAGTLQKLIAK
ncbi:Nn.00g054740.m01.CDS01 [Neocucurbitaria sp. VM-36]